VAVERLYENRVTYLPLVDILERTFYNVNWEWIIDVTAAKRLPRTRADPVEQPSELEVLTDSGNVLWKQCIFPQHWSEPKVKRRLLQCCSFGSLAKSPAGMAICQRAEFVPVIMQEVATMEAVIGLVAAGVGVSIVPLIDKWLHISGVNHISLRES